MRRAAPSGVPPFFVSGPSRSGGGSVQRQASQDQSRRRLRAERGRLAGHRDALPGEVPYDLLAHRMHENGRAAAALRLVDRGLRVVDVADVLGGVRDAPDVLQEGGVQDRRVQGAPGVRAVGADRTVEEGGVGAVDEVEAAVSRQEEGVAFGRGLREGLQSRRQGLSIRRTRKEPSRAARASAIGRRLRRRWIARTRRG